MTRHGIASFLGSRISLPFYDTPGEGGGGGGAPHGAGSTAGLGDGALKITSDSMVDLGDGKPVKWGDIVDTENGRYYTRERFDRGVTYLQSEAKKLQESWDKFHAGEGRKPTKPEPNAEGAPDPLEGIRDLSMIDGRTLEKLYKNLHAQGLTPIARMLAQTIGDVTKLKGDFGKFSKTTGSLAEREAASDFESMITKSYGEVGDIKGLPQGVKIDPTNEFLRDLAKDVFLSHDQESWKPGEFNKALNGRLSSLIGFVRTLDKQAVEAAREQKRTWLRPGGNARPAGEAKRKFQKGADIAKMFFETQPQGT